MARRKKHRTQKHSAAEEEAEAKVPKTFIFNKGLVGKPLMTLIDDLRTMWLPNTARNLRVRKSNKLRDFVHVAGPLHVSHFLIVSKTELAAHIRFMRVPRGPTLTFRVVKYCLGKEVAAVARRRFSLGVELNTPPLVVLNNFSSQENHMQLMASMLQNMFPAINVQTLKLSQARRVVLFHYVKEDDTVEMRHFLIRVRPTGLSKAVKNVVLRKKVPSLGDVKDISDYVDKVTGYGSDSDFSDAEDSRVVLPQALKQAGNDENSQSAVQLAEVGPRITMQLVKIQEGLNEGDTLYHKFVEMTPEERSAVRAKRKRDKEARKARQEEQQKNVEKKRKKSGKGSANDEEAVDHEEGSSEGEEKSGKRKKYHPFAHSRKGKHSG